MNKNQYKGGYKWSNGLPMTDDLHDTIDKFYEYAKAQGNTQTRKEVFKTFEKMIMKAAGIEPRK